MLHERQATVTPTSDHMPFGKLRPVEAVTEPVSILAPVCNEAEGIESFVVELVDVVYRYLPEGSEILIQEGGSTDGTKEILASLKQRLPFLEIEYRPTKEGFAAAARRLFARARNPNLLFVDSDGQCVIPEFWKLVPHIKDHDWVIARKNIRRDPFERRVLSRCFNLIARKMFGFEYRDINYGFRICRRDKLLWALAATRHMPTLLNAELVIHAYTAGDRITEIPVHHRPRLYGVSQGLKPSSLLGVTLKAFRGLLELKGRGANGHSRGRAA
jgi:glycosyltransferase involved in cell wall biosynthesis